MYSLVNVARSEERRVGKEGRARGSPEQEKKKKRKKIREKGGERKKNGGPAEKEVRTDKKRGRCRSEKWAFEKAGALPKRERGSKKSGGGAATRNRQ